MPNALIPRPTVHDWSETIGADPQAHQTALTRLLKDQRRLTRFIEENAENMHPATAGVSVYLTGVIVRMFDLAGGRIRNATWAQIREAEAKVNGAIADLLPLDDTFPERARTAGRAQAHILDEAIYALFERDRDTEEDEENEADLDTLETIKVYLLLWVVTEVLDANWRPAKDFEGEAEYAHMHIEPPKKDEEA